MVLNVPTQKFKRFRPTAQDSFEALLCHQHCGTRGQAWRWEMEIDEINLKICFVSSHSSFLATTLQPNISNILTQNNLSFGSKVVVCHGRHSSCKSVHRDASTMTLAAIGCGLLSVTRCAMLYSTAQLTENSPANFENSCRYGVFGQRTYSEIYLPR